MSPTSPPFHGKIYQIKLHLDGVSPMVWRRLLVRDDTSIAVLHGIFQLVMGWENLHLHCFVIHGKDYGIAYDGGMGFPDDPKNVFLRDFRFRPGDRFRYEYDFNIDWKLQVRVEKILDPIAGKQYPSCSGGNNAGPRKRPKELGPSVRCGNCSGYLPMTCSVSSLFRNHWATLGDRMFLKGR